MKCSGFLMLSILALGACDNSNNLMPHDKAARYDAPGGELIMPYPCPDWSQPQTENYRNQNHSNFGCAVNTNLAVQLENPADLYRGHGNAHPDTETTVKAVTDYRAGKIPVPLTPIQSTTAQ